MSCWLQPSCSCCLQAASQADAAQREPGSPPMHAVAALAPATVHLPALTPAPSRALSTAAERVQQGGAADGRGLCGGGPHRLPGQGKQHPRAAANGLPAPRAGGRCGWRAAGRVWHGLCCCGCCLCCLLLTAVPVPLRTRLLQVIFIPINQVRTLCAFCELLNCLLGWALILRLGLGLGTQ